MNDFSPVCIFVYNRPWHTKQTIEALKRNVLADQSDLIIYSDAPKNPAAFEKVKEVRDYIKTITGFKTVSIIERNENLGLARSIINGVTEVINKYGRVIVLEDDLVTSPYFLSFMNNALEIYKNNQKVWHITGWNYSIDSVGLDEVFFWKVMNCSGWGTWSDRWRYFEKNPQKLIKSFTREKIRQFDLEDSGVSGQCSRVIFGNKSYQKKVFH